MYLQRLELKNFRNYSSLEFNPQPGLNILWGANAQGKTNLLEALYLLAASKSFRVKSERELIKWGAESAEIEAQLARADGQEENLTMRWARNPLTKGWERRLCHQGQTVKKLGEFLKVLPLTLFVPGDLALIQGAPLYRRRLLDVLLCKLSPSYYLALTRYQESLRQRNKLLHKLALKVESPQPLSASQRQILEVWDLQFCEWGAKVLAERLRVLRELGRVVNEVYNFLAQSEGPRLELRYRGSLSRELLTASEVEEVALEAGLRQALEASLKRDLSLRSTQVGPHRDDFAIEAQGHNLRLFGSQGQHRSLSLALRLAEAQVMAQVRQEAPLLLLDDSFSELDPERSRLLLRYLLPWGQVFVTTAFPPRFFKELPAGQYYRVQAGEIERIDF